MGNCISTGNAAAHTPDQYAMNVQSQHRPDGDSNTRRLAPTRPDLTNIDNLPAAEKQARTASALKPFLHQRYNMFQVAAQLGMNPQMSEGACMGLSAGWHMSERKTDQMSYPVKVDAAISFQARYEKDRSRQGEQNLPNFFRNEGFYLNKEDYAGAENLSSLAQSPGSYIICMAGFGQGHAVAMHVPDQKTNPNSKVAFFDSLNGEFKFSPADAAYFFRAYEGLQDSQGQRYQTMQVFNKP